MKIETEMVCLVFASVKRLKCQKYATTTTHFPTFFHKKNTLKSVNKVILSTYVILYMFQKNKFAVHISKEILSKGK